MGALNMVFGKILEMSMAANVAIVVVLSIRLPIKRISGSLAYALWIAVAFRLAIPVSIGTALSIWNIPAAVHADKMQAAAVSVEEGGPAGLADDRTMSGDAALAAPAGASMLPAREDSADAMPASSIPEKIEDVIQTIWLAGATVLLTYMAVSWIRFRRKTRYSVHLRENIYECGGIRSPFVMGLIAPRIFIPFRLGAQEQQCILLHEQYHIRRKDHLIKCAAYLIAVVYWFDPLVWIAYGCMCRDMEMSCDEKVIARLGDGIKRTYSMALLSFAANRRHLAMSPPAFGEAHVAGRIRNILAHQEPARWKMAAGVAAVVAVTAACATDPVADTKEAVNETTHVMEKAPSEDMAAPAVQPAENIAHQPAQWAKNSMFDMEFPSLDFADRNKIVFHISSGLFEYSLNKSMITASLDLQALGFQEIQTGGKCRVEVHAGPKSRLMAVVTPYPYRDEDRYLYDFDTDTLTVYDEAALDGYEAFAGLVPKYELADPEGLGISASAMARISDDIVSFGNDIYGVLFFQDARLSTLRYASRGGSWDLFKGWQATLPELLRQDDSFYASYAQYCGQDISRCLLEYPAFYGAHDFAGLCALSEGLEYSDALQEEWRAHTDMLLGGTVISESSAECIVRYTRCDDVWADEGELVEVSFVHIEGKGWRAEGLPVPVL